MSRINVSTLKSEVCELSREEMQGAVGGARVVCRPELRLVTVRLPFGIKIRVPKLVVVCRVVR
jgi:hypothetical protein